MTTNADYTKVVNKLLAVQEVVSTLETKLKLNESIMRMAKTALEMCQNRGEKLSEDLKIRSNQVTCYRLFYEQIEKHAHVNADNGEFNVKIIVDDDDSINGDVVLVWTTDPDDDTPIMYEDSDN